MTFLVEKALLVNQRTSQYCGFYAEYWMCIRELVQLVSDWLGYGLDDGFSSQQGRIFSLHHNIQTSSRADPSYQVSTEVVSSRGKATGP